MRRGKIRRIAILLAMIVLTLGLFSSTALAGVFDLIPPRPAEAGAYTETPVYERFDLSAYVFDYKDSYAGPQDKQFMSFTNTLLLIKTWLVKLSIRVMEYAANGDLIGPLTQTATEAMSALEQWIWEIDGAPLVVAALAFTALWSLIAVLARRLTRSIQIMAGTALVLVASYALLAVIPTALPDIREISRAASQQSIEVVANATQAGSGQDLIIKAGSAAWDTLVYQPWLDGEFNDRTAAAEYTSSGLVGGGILAMNLDERPKIYTDRLPAVGGAIHPHFQPWRPEFIEWRMLLALFTLFAGAVYAVSLLLLSGGIIFYQLVLLVAVALLPLWLLVALWWPQGSIRIIKRILAVGLGALFKQAALAIILAVVLALTLAMKTVLPGTGWVLQALLAALLAFAAYRYRFAWLKGLTVPFTVVSEKSRAGVKQEEYGERPVLVPVTYTEDRRTEEDSRESMASPTLQLPRWSDEGREAAMSPNRPVWASAAGPAEFRREMIALRQR